LRFPYAFDVPSRMFLVYKSSFISLLFVFICFGVEQGVHDAFFILCEKEPGDFESLFYWMVHEMLD
jgi:hypothetical protein